MSVLKPPGGGQGLVDTQDVTAVPGPTKGNDMKKSMLVAAAAVLASGFMMLGTPVANACPAGYGPIPSPYVPGTTLCQPGAPAGDAPPNALAPHCPASDAIGQQVCANCAQAGVCG
jgi:hypothetical protein